MEREKPLVIDQRLLSVVILTILDFDPSFPFLPSRVDRSILVIQHLVSKDWVIYLFFQYGAQSSKNARKEGSYG